MESAPLPPHERSWRHPSELAADDRAVYVTERPSTAARTLALLTGATGMVLVGIAVLALTPRSVEPPLAIGSTPSPEPGVSPAPPPDRIDRGPLAVAQRRILVSFLETGTNGGGSSATVAVRIVDGSVAVEPAAPGFVVARKMPADHEMVVVLADTPIQLPFALINGVEVDDGAAVVNSDGQLIGVCAESSSGSSGSFIPIDELLVGATTPPD